MANQYGDGPLAEVEIELINETDTAYLVRLDEDCEEVWLPKSQVVSVVSEVSDEMTGEVVMMTIELPEWVAIDKGLV